MAENLSIRMCEHRTLASGQTGEVFDCGNGKTLIFGVQLIGLGDNGYLEFQHAVVNVDSAFDVMEDKDGNEAKILCGGTASTGVKFIYIHDFGRYIRWITDSAAGTPTVQIDVIVKEY